MALSFLTSAASAEDQVFGVRDLEAIVKTSQDNELRFNRDYKGQMFATTLPFFGLDEGLFGGWNIQVGSGSFMPDVECSTEDMDLVNTLIDKNVGDQVILAGVIDTTIMGVLKLTDCQAK